MDVKSPEVIDLSQHCLAHQCRSLSVLKTTETEGLLSAQAATLAGSNRTCSSSVVGKLLVTGAEPETMPRLHVVRMLDPNAGLMRRLIYLTLCLRVV